MVATFVVLGMVTGLSIVYFYRHLNDNLTVLDIENQLKDRPEKKHSTLPKEALNIMVMGSDDRDGNGNNIDGLTGGGARSDTTLLFHLSADRKNAYGISIRATRSSTALIAPTRTAVRSPARPRRCGTKRSASVGRRARSTSSST